jgi:acyl-CoA thioesterase FadM
MPRCTVPSPADYAWTTDPELGPHLYDHLGHMANVAVVEVLADARTAFFGSLRGEGVHGPVLVRHLVVSYVREARPGEALRCGVRAVARGTSSLTLDQVLWRVADEEVVAEASAVHVSWDLATRATIPVRPAMLAAIEARQGAPVPVVARRATTA